MVVPSGRVGGDHVTFQYCVAGVLGVGEEENSGRNPFPFLLLESRTGNPLSPEPFVSRAKALTAKRSEKGMGTRIYLCKIISLYPDLSRPGETQNGIWVHIQG